VTATHPSRRFPIGATIATVVALAILCGLGAWQVQRLAWKRHILAQIATLEHAPAQPLATVLERARRGSDVSYTRVSLACPGLASAPYVELYGIVQGRPGARLISACPAPGGGWSGVLVDRGFTPDATPKPPLVDGGSKAVVVMTGILRQPEAAGWVTPPHHPGEKRWFFGDVAGMAKALNLAAPAPYLVAAETSTSPDLTLAPLPTDIPNRHLEYALTWFGFAGVLLVIYAAFLVKHFRKAAP
jgi:surfeit locus 1 family protein